MLDCQGKREACSSASSSASGDWAGRCCVCDDDAGDAVLDRSSWSHRLPGTKVVRMSWCFCLVPHHVLGVVAIGQKELYYNQVPKNTRSMTGAVLSSFRSRSE